MAEIKFGNPLYGAEIRLARARQLIGTMQRQYQRWADLHEGIGYIQNFDRRTGLLRLTPKIAADRHKHIPRISLTLGEIVYNVRSALDFLVYSIARYENGGVEIDGTQFPLEDDPDTYWMRWSGTSKKGKPINAKAQWLKKVPKEVADDLANYQPFAGCAWVTMIRDISNRDKHRHLSTLTIRNSVNIDGGITGTIDPVKHAQSIHFEGHLVIGIFLPTGEDVIDAAHLIQREARALIRGYAGFFPSDFPFRR